MTAKEKSRPTPLPLPSSPALSPALSPEGRREREGLPATSDSSISSRPLRVGLAVGWEQGKLSSSVGLTFVVGDARAALGESFGASVDAALRGHFPQLSADEGEIYTSDDVPVAGWRALPARGSTVMQAPRIPAIDGHLAG